jgi:integrase/recombinase XerD
MVAGGSGRTSKRDQALLLCSITMGLRVTEIAYLEVRHIMGEDGKYLSEGLFPGTCWRSGRSAAIFPVNRKLQKSLDEYFAWRIEKKHLLSGDLTKYRGLKPDGRVFLTETGYKFAMSKKRRTNNAGVKAEYDASDVLERLFKRLYRRAFGKETKFSSHSGRKTFVSHIINLIEKKAIPDTGYEDVVELMRSHNITSVNPYLVPRKRDIIEAGKGFC